MFGGILIKVCGENLLDIENIFLKIQLITIIIIIFA
jgi:hypothetical protein